MEPFEFVRPTDIQDVLVAIRRPGSRILAGGTSLVDLMKLGVEAPSTVVDINALPLSMISVEGDALSIGALASNSDVAVHRAVKQHAPAVGQALLSGASGQIRNAATVGGNLLQRTRCTYFRSRDWPCNKREPGSGCAAIEGVNVGHAVLGISRSCIAVHPSDIAVALLAVDAYVHLASVAGERRIAIGDFYCQPGDTPSVETVIGPNELITKVEIPITNLNATSSYLKLRGRASYEFASASVATAILRDGDIVIDAAVAVGGLGTVPWRNRTAEKLLIGKKLTQESILAFCDALFAPASATPSNTYKLALARGAIHRTLRGGAEW
ncbi:xanthine dehydrogenase family protein subunit M [Microvirga sp. BT689]|uniref:FAD binding domain-containing protein n=1 Tax=Microvirga arvi TaxID=2778731 RepID=UPI00194E3761|nr:xanthine dehydrogenase family protein subunit M [Microvirga arvi]MBM6581164.1 xanthine dehydrogenase family protein subunit M [Microvirga arvi]